jgi:DNA-binding CsgD family transcriptional regulator
VSRNSNLTAEQRRLLKLLAGGCTAGEAAQRLGLSLRTAERRLSDARATLGARTNPQAIIRAGIGTAQHAPASLSGREREVLALVGEGLHDDEIAARLGIARSTVGSLLRTAMATLGVHSRAEAVARMAERP